MVRVARLLLMNLVLDVAVVNMIIDQIVSTFGIFQQMSVDRSEHKE
jgi:hypothetical protein